LFKESLRERLGDEKWEWISQALDRAITFDNEEEVARIITAALEAGFELPTDKRWPNEIKKENDMDAKEARQLNDEYAAKVGIGFEDIEQRIRFSASKGKTQISVSLEKIDSSYRDRAYKTVSETFGSKGFKVSRSTYGGDSREPRGYDVANISW
jgi:hypothetical protein